MAEPENFLARWSQRKLVRRKEVEEPAAATPDVAAAAVPADGTVEAAGPADAAPPPDLPDVETLNKNSDFTPFLQASVPAELRRLALRKLWRSDPLLANLDGLNDYDGDFTGAGEVGGLVRTAWRVGKGFMEAADEVNAAPAQKAGADDTASASAEESQDDLRDRSSPKEG